MKYCNCRHILEKDTKQFADFGINFKYAKRFCQFFVQPKETAHFIIMLKFIHSNKTRCFFYVAERCRPAYKLSAEFICSRIYGEYPGKSKSCSRSFHFSQNRTLCIPLHISPHIFLHNAVCTDSCRIQCFLCCYSALSGALRRYRGYNLYLCFPQNFWFHY